MKHKHLHIFCITNFINVNSSGNETSSCKLVALLSYISTGKTGSLSSESIQHLKIL